MPVVSLIGSSDMTVDVNTTYAEPGLNYSSDYYSYGSLVLTNVSNLDMTKLGTYSIVYTITDPSNNKTSITRVIHVVDRIAPVITLIGDDPYILPRYQAYVDQGIMLSDNYYTEAQLKPLMVADYSKVRNDLPGLYYVSFNVTDPSGNVANNLVRSVRVIDMFMGVNNIKTNGQLKIYPNPSNGKFTIDLENGTVAQTVKVYSIIGSLVQEIAVNKNSKSIDVDMTGLNEGIYIVKVEGDGKTFTHKINIVK
jgi:hypothetical protein